MTVNGRKYSLPSRIKDIMRFQETFPSNNSMDYYLANRSSARSLSPSPTHNRRLLGSCLETVGDNEAVSKDDMHPSLLSFRNRSCSASNPSHSFSLRVPLRSIDSNRSSTVSLPDVIEEVSSEEDVSSEQSVDYDYMSCAKCKNTNSSTSLHSETDSPSYQQINYCYKCKHLYQGKVASSLSVPQMFHSDSRRIPWTSNEPPYSPSASRKNSAVENELPIISEPIIDEEANDTEEMQKIVNKEVDKLIKFNTLGVNIQT